MLDENVFKCKSCANYSYTVAFFLDADSAAWRDSLI